MYKIVMLMKLPSIEITVCNFVILREKKDGQGSQVSQVVG